MEIRRVDPWRGANPVFQKEKNRLTPFPYKLNHTPTRMYTWALGSLLRSPFCLVGEGPESPPESSHTLSSLGTLSVNSGGLPGQFASTIQYNTISMLSVRQQLS